MVASPNVDYITDEQSQIYIGSDINDFFGSLWPSSTFSGSSNEILQDN